MTGTKSNAAKVTPGRIRLGLSILLISTTPMILNQEGGSCDGLGLPTSLQGVVWNSVSDRPVRGAIVGIEGYAEADGCLNDFLCTVTDSDGFYVLSGLTPGPRNLAVFAEGYESRTLEVVVADELPEPVDIEMSHLIIEGLVSFLLSNATPYEIIELRVGFGEQPLGSNLLSVPLPTGTVRRYLEAFFGTNQSVLHFEAVVSDGESEWPVVRDTGFASELYFQFSVTEDGSPAITILEPIDDLM